MGGRGGVGGGRVLVGRGGVSGGTWVGSSMSC